MSSLFRFGFFLITGCFIALLVSGNPWPLITSIFALLILVNLFGGSSGGGGAGSAKNRHRRCPRHRWFSPDLEDDDVLFRVLVN